MNHLKIYLKDGTEKWILLHTEIEGGSQHDFAFRIFQYHYRLLDRYHVPVETIAVFTGDKNQHRPSEYCYQGIDTSIRFCYRASLKKQKSHYANKRDNVVE